ncbi:MAG TPA: hypothetical protein VM925_17135 [Labilithrix sp.]|nr:hypothetical protein [Labilithrix sp.]
MHRLRVSLLALGVALAAVISIIGSYVRAPHALLGVAFARACAAESAATDGGHPRLRADGEDAHVADVEGLAPSPRVAKTAALLRDGDGGASARVGTTTMIANLATSPFVVGDSGLGRRPIDPPTRGRARLMVFLN